MPDREPEPWESGAAAPSLWIETPRGDVEVWALGEDRFGVRRVERDADLRRCTAAAVLSTPPLGRSSECAVGLGLGYHPHRIGLPSGARCTSSR
jgi:hypothetical protein